MALRIERTIGWRTREGKGRACEFRTRRSDVSSEFGTQNRFREVQTPFRPQRRQLLEHVKTNDVINSVHVGVAGWSYPDWRGVLYPRAKGKGSDDLQVIASLFDCVEINSTFYREPTPRHAESWARTVDDRPGFRFTAKVQRDLTHERSVSPENIRSGCERMRQGLEPLVDAGRLDVVLAQFPPWFQDGSTARHRIRCIVEGLRPLNVQIEVRHRSFFSRSAPRSFFQFLEELGAGFTNVDMPPGASTLPPSTVNTNAIGYVRLHGRNAEAWFDPKAGRDATYDYLYSQEELTEWSERLLTIASRTLSTYAIANNHFRGQAPTNAIELINLFGRPVRALPPSLVALYPRLARLEQITEEHCAAERTTGGEAT